MLKIFGSLLVIVSVSSCAVFNPVYVERLESGQYELRVYGNVFSSQKKLGERIASKAKKLCGKQGFSKVVKPQYAIKTQNQYLNGQMMPVTSISQTQKIVCNYWE